MTQYSKDKLWMGPGTLEVPKELFALNRKRLVERLRSCNVKGSVVVLQGGSEIPTYDTDTTYLFRQESYFIWAFGVLEPDCYGAVEVDSGKTHLFVPRQPPEYAIWPGPILTLEEYGHKYAIENVHYTDQILDVLQEVTISELLTLVGRSSTSGLCSLRAQFPGIQNFKENTTVLYNEMADLRVFKTDLELKVMRYAIDVSSEAHRKMMRMAGPEKLEYQCESEFLNHGYYVGGCRNVAYTCVCGSGTNSSYLHYGHAAAPNDKVIKDGDMCLFDMGASYFGYSADVTCSFPANGTFTEDQKFIYNAVLKANRAVANAAKPGVAWYNMHLLAQRTLLEELKWGGLVRGDLDEMMRANLGYVFQPHGLGHLLGLDVHDVGGYLGRVYSESEGANEKQKLRTTRVLEKGMVITIEPGCYFIDMLLDDPQYSEYLEPEAIKRFRGFGGVRIEDDVLITETGVENLTKVPRTVQEIERWMAGNDDDKYKPVDVN